MKHNLLLFTLVAVTSLLSACGSTPNPFITPTVTALPSLTLTATITPTLIPTATSTPEPVWYQQIDLSYAVLEYRYGLVNDSAAKIFLTLDDAMAGNGNFGPIGEAPIYIYITGEHTIDGKTWFATRLGWISADNVQLVTPSLFRGILLVRQVEFRFGWVLKETQSINASGSPIRTYTRYEIVYEVPSVVSNPGYFPIGPDEWLPLDAIAVTAAPLPADIATGQCRFIYVDLSTQIMRVYDACQLIFATLVSTGEDPRWTYPDRYSILNKIEYTKLTQPSDSVSVYSLEGVPYFMSYAGDWGFHAAYWHDDFGTPVSHGCVNLSPADAHWLFDWAREGENVIIVRSETP